MPKVIVAATIAVALSAPGFCQTKPLAKKQPKKSAVETEAEKQAAARKHFALDLIKRSYALDEQVEDKRRHGLLSTQISVASKLDKKLAHSWARELFDLGVRENDKIAQVAAIQSLSEDDQEEALALLARLNSSVLAPEAHELPNMNAVIRITRVVFQEYVRKQGKAVLQKILVTAAAMGENGRYPYSPVMAAAEETEDDVVIQNTGSELFTRFQQSVDSDTDAIDFAMMLQSAEVDFPDELMKDAVDLAVERIEKSPVDDESKDLFLRMQTGDQTSIAHGPVAIGLMQCASLIRDVDPELWTRLMKTYPELTSAPVSNGAHLTTMSIGFGDRPSDNSPPAAAEQKEELTNRIRREAFDFPDRLDATIGSIQDERMRVEAWLLAAQMNEGRSPENWARFTAEAQKAATEIKDPVMQFQMACVQLRADVAKGNRGILPQDLNSAFELADKALRKSRDEGRGTGFLISPLLEAAHDAMKIEPELTVAHIESIYLPYEKAQLLTAAASAMAAPVVVKPPAKVEEAEKQAK